MPNNPVYQNKSWSYNNIIEGASGSITVDATTELIRCDTTAGPVNITLLELSDFWNPDYKLLIHDYGTDGTDGNASVNPITITVNQIDERINGQSTLVISQNRGSVSISPVDNKNWLATTSNVSGSGSDFYHKYAVFVDPEGDDATGEFGNMHKPFATPYKALLSAVNYMPIAGIPVIPLDGQDIYTSTVGGETYSVIKDVLRRIEIHVFPGFYNSAIDSSIYLEGNIVNLMYNHIDWYLHPGAIMYDYYFSDGFNNIDSDVSPLIQGRPVSCNVYGEGTFIFPPKKGGDRMISLENPKSVFNFNAESSSGSFYIEDGNFNYNLKRCFAFTRGGSAYFSWIGGGKINLNIDEVKWIVGGNLNIFAQAFLYQGDGELNANIKKYTATTVLEKIFSEGSAILITKEPDDISTYFYGGYPDPYSWDYRYYDIGVEDYAPYFGAFDSENKKSNISIDYGKFYGICFISLGGDIKFYPKTIEIGTVYTDSSVDNFCTLGIFGGPDAVNDISKFSIFGGKIIYKIYQNNNYGLLTTQSLGIGQQDDSQVYVKETLFYFEGPFDLVYGNAYFGPPFSTYQDRALILDGAKYYAPDAITKYNFFADYNFLTSPEIPFEVKIYNNCFSDFDPAVWDPIGVSVINVIPWTTMIIDPNVQII